MAKNSGVTILLVEDDDVEAELLEREMAKAGMENPVRRACDGVEALDILKRGDEYPCVMLLDLKMPRLGGLELLNEIRRDQHLRNTVVFVVTTSRDFKDRQEAYSKNVAGYILKTQPGSSYGTAVQMLRRYLSVVDFPRGN